MRLSISVLAKTAALTGFAASVIIAAIPAQASTIALQSFSDGGTVTGAFNRTIGWYFTANDNLIVDSLGFWDVNITDPLSQSHQVGIWDSSQNLLGSATVLINSPLTDQFRYESVVPINLNSGSIYYLGATIASPFTDVYSFSNLTLTVASEITFGGAVQSLPDTGFSFPTVINNGNGRFGPNFQFTTASAVPEPLTILGAATAVGFGAKFKRRLAQSQKGKKDVA